MPAPASTTTRAAVESESGPDAGRRFDPASRIPRPLSEPIDTLSPVCANSAQRAGALAMPLNVVHPDRCTGAHGLADAQPQEARTDMTNPHWQQPGANPPPYGAPPPHQPNPPYQQPPYQQGPFPPVPPQQAPYGQPYPGGWGQPPMGPPQKDRGKAVAIAVVVLVVAAGVIGVIRESVSGDSTPSGPSASPEYKLSLPQTLDGGTYALGDDLSAMVDERVPDSGRNTRNVTPVAGQYSAGSGTETRALVFTGYYGTFDNPEESKASFLKGVSEGEGAEVPAPPKTFTPAGSDEDVTCEVLVKHEGAQEITVPVCVWVDNGTLGSVLESDATSLGASPESIDLRAFADKVGRIRDEVRVPLV